MKFENIAGCESLVYRMLFDFLKSEGRKFCDTGLFKAYMLSAENILCCD
jgi:hypothetical protein